MSHRTILLRLSTIVLAVVCVLILAHTAHAATFTVTSTGDESAVDPTVACTTAGDTCTLRSSIEAANAQAGADEIDFNIAGGGVQTISPASDYDQINEQVTIDGSTQTGASCGTLVPSNLPANSNTPHTLLIEIDGSGAGTGGGFTIGSGSDGSIVRGLILNNSQDRPEIQVNANTVTVECNYIGTNADGNTAGVSNTSDGITVSSGDSPTVQNNLVSGNVGVGISVTGNQSAEASVANNLVGLTANGLSALANTIGIEAQQNVNLNHNIISGNTTDGVFIDSNNVNITGSYIGVSMNGSALGNGGSGINTNRNTNSYVIGGAGDGNVISANTNNGISIASRSGDSCPVNNTSEIFSNKIGTNTNGEVQTGFGNGGSGIAAWESSGSGCVNSVYKHQIGGENTGEPNIIAGNAQDGIRVYEYNNPGDETDHTDVFSISILQNSIFGNSNLGINLASASDAFDGIANVDIGPNALNSFLIDYPASHANNYLNKPTINSNITSGNNVTVNYNFQAPPGITPSNDGYSLLPTDLVGYRLDFYINNGTQDGAYNGYSQGATHLGSFVVDGGESGATHTFTSPIPLGSNQNITATATILWKVVTCQESGNARQGNGPPYSNNCGD
jgi:hypothetical protein